MRIILLLLVLLTTTACQRTLFQHAPGSGGCDPDLAGEWWSLGDADDPDGEVQATIGRDCSITVLERNADGERLSAASTLGSTKLAGRGVVWFDAAWANRSFDIDGDALDQPGDRYVYAYRLDRDKRLTLFPVRHEALARAAVDNRLKADVLLLDGSLTVRVRAEPDELRRLLGRKRVFDDRQPLRFRRHLDGQVER